MCDYSLHLVASRPAKVAETLITTKFQGFTRGFSSVEDRNVAVCLLPGTELAFEKKVQYETYGFWRSERQVAHKVARFRQINQRQRDVHHDALEFPDGRIVLLTQLCEGQRATVLQLPARPSAATADETERRHLSRHRDLRTVA
jgi:hypothetical protein